MRLRKIVLSSVCFAIGRVRGTGARSSSLVAFATSSGDPLDRSRATLIATLTEAPSDEDLTRLSEEADVLEVRADQVGGLDREALSTHFRGRLLYTLRSKAEGGGFGGSPEERVERILAEAEGYDLVDLEADRDLVPELLTAIEPARRILSWHGPPTPLSGLSRKLGEMTEHPACWYKLIPAAMKPGDDLAPLALLLSARRDDVIAFASRDAGLWTRLVAPRIGAPVVYGAASAVPGAPGQPTIESLRATYDLPNLPPVEKLFGIVGHPVGHSLSPLLHNSLYRELGIPGLYLPFETISFGDFWLEIVESGSLEVLGHPLAGLSVTAPYKELAVAVAGACSPLAERINSANTLVRRDGVWEGETTDPHGVVHALVDAGAALEGARAVVVGCGGAGRAAAFGLQRSGSRVTLVNRTEARGREIAREIGLDFCPQEEFDPTRFEILVNATPLGHGADDPFPFDLDALSKEATIVDLVYRRGEHTALVSSAAERGMRHVDGRDILLFQAVKQFRLMTGRDMAVEIGREILGL